VQQVTGKVTITGADNVTRVAGPKERILSGDTVTTEAKSETLIKMADDSTIIVRPNTQFQFTEFKYEKKESDSSFVKLLRGTARMVTGLIGKRNHRNVGVTTITATIGIRGTDFEVAVITEDTPEARAGVYNLVHDGSTNIKLTQLDRNLDVKKNQTAFAPDKLRPGEEPLQILRDTPIFLQQGGGLDALIQSITIQIPMFR
ncbi:MAG: FecR family protein, partial [Burkholderiales bacterium]